MGTSLTKRQGAGTRIVVAFNSGLLIQPVGTGTLRLPDDVAKY
jgi:hypothetical protein